MIMLLMGSLFEPVISLSLQFLSDSRTVAKAVPVSRAASECRLTVAVFGFRKLWVLCFLLSWTPNTGSVVISPLISLYFSSVCCSLFFPHNHSIKGHCYLWFSLCDIFLRSSYLFSFCFKIALFSVCCEVGRKQCTFAKPRSHRPSLHDTSVRLTDAS